MIKLIRSKRVVEEEDKILPPALQCFPIHTLLEPQVQKKKERENWNDVRINVDIIIP